MTTLFSSHEPQLTWRGHPVVKGALLRNTVTGDVGHLEWASSLSMSGDRPSEWDDYWLKVVVWRAGRSRLWRGKNVEVVLGDDNDVEL